MPLKKACQLLAENLTKRATNFKKRDEELAQQLADIVHQNPPSNILVIRGHGHRPSLEQALTAQHVSFTSVTPHEEMSTFFIDELIQKIMAGERPTRRELVRSLVERVMTKTPSFRPTNAGICSLRDSVDSMSELQCEKYLKKRLNLT
jgi:hypothetical protein